MKTGDKDVLYFMLQMALMHFFVGNHVVIYLWSDLLIQLI